MQNDLQLHRKYVANINYKPPNLSTIFETIKQRKAEFIKQLDQINYSALPIIKMNRTNVLQVEAKSTNHQTDDQQIRYEKQQSRVSKDNTLSNSKYKTIIESRQIGQKLHINNKKREEIPTISKKEYKIETNQQKQSKNKVKIRTKTQVKDLQLRKLTNPSNSTAQKIKEEIQIKNIDEAKKLFTVSVEQIPKIMKMRNQDNLTQSINHLQQFNPFFNRNQRIVNICLLKMGRILLRDSPYQLYKAGQQLEHFYIIMLGKVKIADGSNRRVCQTGETVLQQIIFSEKAKKVSLQRAKIIGATYLLELKIDEYKKMKQQLIRFGLKIGFQEMQTIIKRNYIIKNWMRNKRKLESNK